MPLTNTDANFWWLRYFCGLALPLIIAVCGIHSITSRHSYTVWAGRGYGVHLVAVSGEQAVLMGVAYLGVALVLFANYYAQYHEKMAFYYQWLLAPGALMAGGGVIGRAGLFLIG